MPRPTKRSPEMGDARTRLLNAALAVIRAQGYAATTVDQLCQAAGVTKGAFFHHFPSKEALAVAAADHWSTLTGALFAAAPYHQVADPLGRVLAYLDFRRTLLGDRAVREFTCLAGTLVQEAFDTTPAIRDACAASICGHAATLEADLQAALDALGPAAPAGVTARSLALHTQAVLQGSFILAKALGDAAPVADAIEHLQRYLGLLLAPAATPPFPPPLARPTTPTPGDPA